MKIAKQVYVDNIVKTVIEFSLSGAVTHAKASIGTMQAQHAIQRPCRACTPIINPLINQGWWKEFGLTKNPYIYGPMPYKRTSERYRIEEARRMGWTAWSWHDEYEDERKGITSGQLKNQ